VRSGGIIARRWVHLARDGFFAFCRSGAAERGQNFAEGDEVTHFDLLNNLQVRYTLQHISYPAHLGFGCRILHIVVRRWVPPPMTGGINATAATDSAASDVHSHLWIYVENIYSFGERRDATSFSCRPRRGGTDSRKSAPTRGANSTSGQASASALDRSSFPSTYGPSILTYRIRIRFRIREIAPSL
jgi:hypothetical protein